MSNVIPPITSDMGKYWEQPPVKNIKVHTTHALMAKSDYKKLHNYSHSFPTGVYEGKMWCAEEQANNAEGIRRWLMWYSNNSATSCKTNSREVFLT